MSNQAEQNNDHVSDVSFWKKMFDPRPTQWQRETLKRLRAKQSMFDNDGNHRNKIQALEELLS